MYDNFPEMLLAWALSSAYSDNEIFIYIDINIDIIGLMDIKITFRPSEWKGWLDKRYSPMIIPQFHNVELLHSTILE